MKTPNYRYLKKEELKALWQTIQEQGTVRDELLFKWMYTYGLRVVEAVNIRLEDLNAETLAVLEVRRVKGGIGRPYSVSQKHKRLLQKWLKERSTLKTARNNDFLFISSRSYGQSIPTITAQKAFERYARLAEIAHEKRHCHVLRHTCAISMLLKGIEVFTICSWLGHKNIENTMVYLKIMPPEWKRLSKDIVEECFIT